MKSAAMTLVAVGASFVVFLLNQLGDCECPLLKMAKV